MTTLVSWNVNGIRAVSRKGFWDWLKESQPDILCLQETRIQDEQMTAQMRQPSGYHANWFHAERKGYSGVATLSRLEPGSAHKGFDQPQFDMEGRVLITKYEWFTLVNAYFPSGQRGHDRVAFKLQFTEALLAYCTDLRSQGQKLVVCGDYNTAHRPIDLARPSQNEKTSGFLPKEREALGRWLECGFVDAFRHLHPETVRYSWWTYRANARARNVGWRIDYFLVDEMLMPQVRAARILDNVMGSDHCPVELVLDSP